MVRTARDYLVAASFAVAMLGASAAAADPCATEDARTWPVYISQSGGPDSRFIRSDFVPANEIGRQDLYTNAPVETQVGIAISSFATQQGLPNSFAANVRAGANMQLPLCAFAQRGEVDALSDQLTQFSIDMAQMGNRVTSLETALYAEVNALSGQIAQFGIDAAQMAHRATALASALHSPAPAPGSNFRAGVEFGTAGSEQAVGFNFSARQGVFDFSAAAAFANSESAGRIGGGVSW